MLLIVNQAYPRKAPVNPVNDARAVAQTLQELGFAQRDIRLVLDARQSDLRRGVREFIEGVKPGDLVLVYYSGHGGQRQRLSASGGSAPRRYRGLRGG